MTTGADELTTRDLRLAAVLETWPTRHLDLEQLWAAYDTADPDSAGTGTQRRAQLAAAVHALAATGALTASRDVDTTATPPLPERVTVATPAPSKTATDLATGTDWAAPLEWARTEPLTLGQVHRLTQVNAWWAERGGADDVMPLGERSTQVFADPDTLASLLGTSLFGPGRLTLDLLRTFHPHPPLATRHVGPGDTLLVVASPHTFHTLWDALMTDPGPVGHIAWGAGPAFTASVRSTRDLPGMRRTLYFGDLDATSLATPTTSAATARTEHLPPVQPANILYRMLLHHGHPQGGADTLTADAAQPLLEWLTDPHLQHHAADLLAQGHRIPQETVTAAALRLADGWQHTL